MTIVYDLELIIQIRLHKSQILWHNINARRLDAPLIQAAGIFYFFVDYT